MDEQNPAIPAANESESLVPAGGKLPLCLELRTSALLDLLLDLFNARAQDRKQARKRLNTRHVPGADTPVHIAHKRETLLARAEEPAPHCVALGDG